MPVEIKDFWRKGETLKMTSHPSIIEFEDGVEAIMDGDILRVRPAREGAPEPKDIHAEGWIEVRRRNGSWFGEIAITKPGSFRKYRTGGDTIEAVMEILGGKIQESLENLG